MITLFGEPKISGGGVMTRIAIVCCENIRDKSCIACAKCFKGIDERAGSFEGYEKIEVIGFSGCGGCPGLVVPKLKLFFTYLQSLDRDVDEIFIGTCVNSAITTGNCPIGDVGILKELIELKFGKKIVVGTHPW